MIVGKLPKRLIRDPLGLMETDSDIESIAESATSLMECERTERKALVHLMTACLGYLRDWCPKGQRTARNLFALLDAETVTNSDGHSSLDNRFYEMESGCRKVYAGDGTVTWVPSPLVRNDGLMPSDTNGIDVSDDFSLAHYYLYRHSRAGSRQLVQEFILALKRKENANG